jgi:hypothetical protein
LISTDEEIVAHLSEWPAQRWQELFAVADALTEADREVVWGGGQELSPGVSQVPYPKYSERVNRLRKLLPVLEFNWKQWVKGNPLFPEGHGLAEAPVADAARLSTVYLHGERFNEGAIGIALRSGAFDAIIARLRHWYEIRS